MFWQPEAMVEGCRKSLSSRQAAIFIVLLLSTAYDKFVYKTGVPVNNLLRVKKKFALKRERRTGGQMVRLYKQTVGNREHSGLRRSCTKSLSPWLNLNGQPGDVPGNPERFFLPGKDKILSCRHLA
jgi:hypothetical protein